MRWLLPREITGPPKSAPPCTPLGGLWSFKRASSLPHTRRFAASGGGGRGIISPLHVHLSGLPSGKWACPKALLAVRPAGNDGHPRGLRPSDGRKKPGEREKAGALSNNNPPRRPERRGREDFCGGKPNFPEEKRFLAGIAAGIRRIHAKTGEGGNGGGACFPVQQLVKTIVDKL